MVCITGTFEANSDSVGWVTGRVSGL